MRALSNLCAVARRERAILGAILVVAVLLRVGVALYLGDVVDAPPLLTDQRSYHALGARLLEGHGFSFAKAWYPFTPADTPTAHWSFLYSLIVAGVYGIFGVHPLAMRLVQAVAGGVLLPLAVYRLGRRIFEPATRGAQGEGKRDGSVSSVASPAAAAPLAAAMPLAAAAVTAVYGYFVLYAATIMTETLFITVLVWSLEVSLGVARALGKGQRVQRSQTLQLGLSLSLGTLLRQSLLPWVPVLFLSLAWVAWRQRVLGAAVRVAAVVGVMLAAAILPWTYRNTRAYGQFLLLNSNTGYAMYSGQHPMHGTRFREFDAAPLPEDLAWGNEAAMDSQLMALGVGFVLDDPGRYLLLSLSRVRAFFEFWPTPDTTLIHNLGRVGSFGLFLPFMLYGLTLGARDPAHVRANGLLFLFAAFYTVLHVMTWAMVRYRLPVDAVMIPWAGWALADLGNRALVRLRRGSSAGEVPASAVAVCCADAE